MLTPKQQKLIRKYCLLPNFVIPAMLMPILSAIVALVLITIDHVFLHNSTHFMLMFAEIVLPICFYLVVMTYAVFSVLLGIRSEKWQALVREVAARNNIQPYSVEVFDENSNKYVPAGNLTYDETVCELARHPSNVAELARIELPSIKNLKRIVLFLPIVLQIICFIPQFSSSYDAMEARKEHASVVLEQLKTAFAPICEEVRYDDPKEGYSDAGYTFYAYLPKTEDFEHIYLKIDVEECGQIYDISYNCDINVHRTKEENANMVKQSFEQLHAALLNCGVTFSSAVHTEAYEMSDEFWTAFTEGSYYEEISVDNDDYDDAYVFYRYHTQPEDSYDEYANSYMCLHISTKYSSR